MGHHYDLYKRTMEEAARTRDVAAAKSAASGIRERAAAEVQRLAAEKDAFQRRLSLVGAAAEALRRVEADREALAQADEEIAAATAEIEAMEQLARLYLQDAEPSRLRAEELARLRRDAQAEAHRLLARTKALDAEAASHREQRESAESTLPFERQAREELEGRIAPAEREAREALKRIEETHAEAARKRQAALDEAAAEAARAQQEALAAVEARWTERAAQAMQAAEREAAAQRGRTLADAAAQADAARIALVEKLRVDIDAEASAKADALRARLSRAKADASAPTPAETALPPALRPNEGSVPGPDATRSSLRRALGQVEPVLAVVPLDAGKVPTPEAPEAPEGIP